MPVMELVGWLLGGLCAVRGIVAFFQDFDDEPCCNYSDERYPW